MVSRSDFTTGKIFGKCSVEDQETTSNPKFASASSLRKKFTPLQPRSLNALTVVPKKNDSIDVTKRKGINLEPVDLVQNREGSLIVACPVAKTYWSANWYDRQL